MISENMLKFTGSAISRSMTTLDAEAEKAAVLVFQDILRRMGDIADPSAAQKDAPVVDVAKVSRELCDEVYLQLMKQLAANPSPWSEKAGWELFKVLLNEVLPTRRLQDFVQLFLQNMVGDKGENEEEAFQAAVTSGARRLLSRQASMAFYQEDRPRFAREVLGIFG